MQKIINRNLAVDRNEHARRVRWRAAPAPSIGADDEFVGRFESTLFEQVKDHLLRHQFGQAGRRDEIIGGFLEQHTTATRLAQERVCRDGLIALARLRVGAKAAGAGSGAGVGSVGDSAAEADRTSDFVFEGLVEAASLVDATTRGDVLASVNERADGAFLPSSRLAMKGFAEATMTFEGAGAGEPSRSVAISISSSLPWSGAGPTYSTLTRASPRL